MAGKKDWMAEQKAGTLDWRVGTKADDWVADWAELTDRYWAGQSEWNLVVRWVGEWALQKVEM